MLTPINEHRLLKLLGVVLVNHTLTLDNSEGSLLYANIKFVHDTELPKQSHILNLLDNQKVDLTRPTSRP